MIRVDIGCDFGFPFVTVVEELLLVVEQLFVRLRGKLEIRPFNDSIDWTGFLTEPAVDTFRHIDIVTRRPPGPISTLLGFNCYSLNTSF